MFAGNLFSLLKIEIKGIILISKFIKLYIWCFVRQMHVMKLKISYSRSPVNTLRNDPLTCNTKNPRKTTTIYIYRIKCPAYISNNVTTTQTKSVSKNLIYRKFINNGCNVWIIQTLLAVVTVMTIVKVVFSPFLAIQNRRKWIY